MFPYSLDMDYRACLSSANNCNSAVGWLTGFSGIGGLSLSADLRIPSPGGHWTPPVVNVVGVLKRIKWEGGATDPIRFVCFVSGDNAASIRSKLASPLASTSVSPSWQALGFDPASKSWYQVSKAAAKAAINTKNGELQISVSDSPHREPPAGRDMPSGLPLFKLRFTIEPASGSSIAIPWASGPLNQALKSWGSGDDD